MSNNATTTKNMNDEEIGMRETTGGDLSLPGSSENHESYNVMMDLDDGDVPIEKPVRKMTSMSDATSVTGALSVDDVVDEDESSGKIKPGLDSLHEDDDGESASLIDGKPSCCWIWFKRILLFWVVFGILGFAVVMIGARIERKGFADAAKTHHFYQTNQVCGVENPLTDVMGITYSSVEEAHENGAQVAHCGECGSCSSAHDMAIMSQTADSLTRDSTRCAFKIFIGRRAVEKCMEERVGFTPDCEDCWLDNISCSFKSCKFTCIKHKLFRKDNNKGEELNDCLKCDERMCGPAFIQCSGSNRRRMGIISDIGRDDGDQCQDADVDWANIFDQ